MEITVEAMRQGARDFVLKPWDNETLVASLRRNIRKDEPAGRYSRNELEVATQVQRKLWLDGGRELPSLQVSGFSRPVGAVGGYTYDFIDVGEGRLTIALADVSGKGLPAGDELGEERLVRLARTHATTPVAELAKALVDAVFEALPRQTDDMAIVAAHAT